MQDQDIHAPSFFPINPKPVIQKLMDANHSKRLQKNLELWAAKNPKAALLLPYVDNTTFNPSLLHSQDPVGEANNWFKSLDLNDIQILYVYGVGLGYYLDAAKEWLKVDKAHHLVFLEDDLSVLYHLFGTPKGTEILQHPQVLLYFFHDLKESTAIFETLFWNFVQTNMRVTALEAYAKSKVQRFADLEHKILYDASIKNALLEEYLKYGVGFYKNFYPNMLFLPGSYLGTGLFKKFKQVPAIICGAGPSLGKHVHELGKLKDRALIFAGGSAMNALNASDVQPHFGAGIDPNAEQYKRLSESAAFEVPYFYRNRMFHQAFQSIHGPRLYIPGSGGYDVPAWFEEKLGIKADVMDEGHNVVNFCTQIAYEMGCNPIIFVGVDLAYTGNQQYAPGVVPNAKLEKGNLLHGGTLEKDTLSKTDIEGNQVLTLWKWVAESEWIGDFAKDHPEVTLVNATEGGLGFPGVTNQPLQEVIDDHLKKEYDLSGRVNGEIQNSPLPKISYETLVELMEQFEASLVRCQEYLTALLEESDKVKIRLSKAKKGETVALQTGRAALCETELAEEPGYKYILEVLNLTISLVLTKELGEVEASKRLSDKKKSIRKIEINDKKLVFLRDAAKFNSQIINLTLEGEILAKDALCTPTNIHLKTS